MKNPEFSSKLNEFLNLEIHEQEINSKTDFSRKNDLLTVLLENLGNMIRKHEKNFGKMIHSIMEIRNQYRQMKSIIKLEENLKSHYNVEILFLEIEEKLLNLGILKMEDIKQDISKIFPKNF